MSSGLAMGEMGEMGEMSEIGESLTTKLERLKIAATRSSACDKIREEKDKEKENPFRTCRRRSGRRPSRGFKSKPVFKSKSPASSISSSTSVVSVASVASVNSPASPDSPDRLLKDCSEQTKLRKKDNFHSLIYDCSRLRISNDEEADAADVASCSRQALNPPCDITIDELASYFENYVHIPRKMTTMVEMMYT